MTPLQLELHTKIDKVTHQLLKLYAQYSRLTLNWSYKNYDWVKALERRISNVEKNYQWLTYSLEQSYKEKAP